jgi:hypothetical protein
MSFCPDCEAEYKAGITTCPDCKIDLVPHLTSETRLHDKDHGEPVPLRSFKTAAEAQMVRELLDLNGIRSFVEGADFAVIPSSFSQEVVVMVDERDLDRAVEIHQAYFDSQAPQEDQSDRED